MKTKLVKNSIALIEVSSGTFLPAYIKEGKIIDAKGICIKVEFKFLFFFKYSRWISVVENNNTSYKVIYMPDKDKSGENQNKI